MSKPAASRGRSRSPGPKTQQSSILRKSLRQAEKYTIHSSFRTPSPPPRPASPAPRQVSPAPPRRQRSRSPNRYVGEFDMAVGPIILDYQPVPTNQYKPPSRASSPAPGTKTAPRARRQSKSPVLRRCKSPLAKRAEPQPQSHNPYRRQRSPAARGPKRNVDEDYRPGSHVKGQPPIRREKSPQRAAKKGIPESVTRRLLAESDQDEPVNRKTMKLEKNPRPTASQVQSERARARKRQASSSEAKSEGQPQRKKALPAMPLGRESGSTELKRKFNRLQKVVLGHIKQIQNAMTEFAMELENER